MGGGLARLFGQLTPVKYPSLSPVACSKSSLVVPLSVCSGPRVTLRDAFVWTSSRYPTESHTVISPIIAVFILNLGNTLNLFTKSTFKAPALANELSLAQKPPHKCTFKAHSLISVLLFTPVYSF